MKAIKFALLTMLFVTPALVFSENEPSERDTR